MIVLSEKDVLEVNASSLIADYDRITLVKLYQPIIGYTAVAVYFTLWGEVKNCTCNNTLISHKTFLDRLQMSVGTFVDARKALEGIGLLKTFITKGEEFNAYRYQLFSPRDPKKFFSNTLLYGLLMKSIGKEQADGLKKAYLSEEAKDGEDISASFSEIYHPDYTDPTFMEAINNGEGIVSREKGRIQSSFNYDKFFTSLSSVSQISQTAFTKKDLKEIDRISTLSGIDEAKAAMIVAEIFDINAEKGKKIDFDRFLKECMDENKYIYIKNHKRRTYNTMSGENNLAKKINMMETVPPKKYLSYQQNSTMPALADIKLLNDLSKFFNLNWPTINAIVDFVLTTNQNVLSRPYAEKLASCLVRENIDTAYDALNYFKSIYKNKKVIKIESQSSQPTIKEETKIEIKPAENRDSEEDDAIWDDLISSIGGKQDGKDEN